MVSSSAAARPPSSPLPHILSLQIKRLYLRFHSWEREREWERLSKKKKILTLINYGFRSCLWISCSQSCIFLSHEEGRWVLKAPQVAKYDWLMFFDTRLCVRRLAASVCLRVVRMSLCLTAVRSGSSLVAWTWVKDEPCLPVIYTYAHESVSCVCLGMTMI